jgi:hypothetical protein
MAFPEYSRAATSEPFDRPERLAQLQAAAARLGAHPQDHGWRGLYRLIAAALAQDRPHLHHLLDKAAADRPESIDTHLITLLGIALKFACSHQFAYLTGNAPLGIRAAVLESLALDRGRRVFWARRPSAMRLTSGAAPSGQRGTGSGSSVRRAAAVGCDGAVDGVPEVLS